ncbi:ABC transporter ATP-binding protein [Reyranella soli]|uniref:ABC transporter ATP-binding protein n=1 Tax=Reyranella soli TaxID=1230389 RepID=A0A512N8X9_9HYPH|nr:ABC transporter ATP-binding protein [Reyranella soli]GEP55446.1 ABC transporter ATP-binding protein [Reyranella soli]
MSSLEISALCKRYGPAVALDGVSLTAGQGELVSLLGPSGCGKTTALRCIAGFIDPDDGDIRANGVSILATPSSKRDFGVVFQNYALFPHLNVAENVGYGLLFRKGSKAERERRVREVLEQVQLVGLEHRLPRELSGGQQQRVALARALVIQPRLLLLDEPLANLDARLRDDVRWLIRDVQQASRTTAFYVTHDQAEAMAISDKIAVMKNGKVAQFASPREIYQRPAERYVASFTGEANFLAAEVERALGGGLFRVRAGGATLDVRGAGPFAGSAVLLARPESLAIVTDGTGQLEGRVVKSVFLGAVQHCEVVLRDGASVRLGTPPDRPLPADGTVSVRLDVDRTWLMPDAVP